MKFLFLSLLIFLNGGYLQPPAYAFGGDYEPQKNQLNRSEVFEILEYAFLKTPFESSEMIIDVWGFQFLNLEEKTKKNELFIFLDPWLSSERVWRAYLAKYEIPSLKNNERGFCLHSSGENCNFKSYPFAFVKSKNEEEKGKGDLAYKNFFWMKTQIEETRLVFLVDLVNHLLGKSMENQLDFSKNFAIKWSSGSPPKKLLNQIQKKENQYKIWAVDTQLFEGSKAGYVVWVCSYDAKIKNCDLTKSRIEFRVIFNSENELEISALENIF